MFVNVNVCASVYHSTPPHNATCPNDASVNCVNYSRFSVDDRKQLIGKQQYDPVKVIKLCITAAKLPSITTVAPLSDSKTYNPHDASKQIFKSMKMYLFTYNHKLFKQHVANVFTLK